MIDAGHFGVPDIATTLFKDGSNGWFTQLNEGTGKRLQRLRRPVGLFLDIFLSDFRIVSLVDFVEVKKLNISTGS